jgi:hypothetical protein
MEIDESVEARFEHLLVRIAHSIPGTWMYPPPKVASCE